MKKIEKKNILVFNGKEHEIPVVENSDTMEYLKKQYADEPTLIAVFYLYLLWVPKGQGIEIEVTSGIPIAAGLGSSSSFAVCLVSAYLLVTGQIVDLEKSLDRVNEYAYLLECIFHGTPSGIDNSIATFGGAISFTKKDGIKRVAPSKSIKILITNTKVPKDTKKMVSGVRSRFEENPEKMNAFFNEIQSVSEKCLDLFEKQHDIGFEELIDKNQVLLNNIGVGHSTIDKIVEITKRHGCSTKLTGGGGGGCVFTFIKDDGKELTSNLEMEGFACYQSDLGGKGVCIE